VKWASKPIGQRPSQPIKSEMPGAETATNPIRDLEYAWYKAQNEPCSQKLTNSLIDLD
jgi:hypothetical protein